MSKIRKSAKGEQCQVRYWWVDYHNPETVVYAHANGLKYGKGMGLKASDEHGAYACHICHGIYDGHIRRPEGVSKEYADEVFEKGMEATRVKLIKKGLL